METDSGAYPLFTEKVSVFYRGTFITGEEFDGNFDGFGATDREIPLPLSDPLSENSPESKWPTAFNSPSDLWYPKLLRAGHGLCNICGSVSVGCCIFPGRADMVQAVVHPVIFPVIRH